MHEAAFDFIATHAPDCSGPVLEIGSRDINGSVRRLFPSDGYHGIDLHPGPGVDEIADVLTFTHPTKFRTVVCCEVLEHHPDPAGIIAAAYELLEPGGTLLVTAAGPLRTPHSGLGSGPMEPGEFYRNVDPVDLVAWLDAFDSASVGVVGADVRARAVRPMKGDS